MKRLLLATAALSACALVAPGAWAQAYPVKPVRVVIPWPPGGSNDVVGRLVLQRLTQTMGQQFVVDNRAGAAGSIGAEVVAKAPDGKEKRFTTKVRIDTPVELEYYQNGGVLQTVLRKLNS